ncbi:hypothetical protein [Actinomycetospora termitidis]|uniref:Lipoprotein n=1 Tax=Actinomycetospora termitidis TaxID=3053470 RepID=A0ABT7M602_9PSEU|nr:hypothetical protein [Actinomycetospora sp. Odt1-22]MDL5156050.1 hypothetical protein [Actinomycetospora sp. Odt1-22]
MAAAFVALSAAGFGCTKKALVDKDCHADLHQGYFGTVYLNW